MSASLKNPPPPPLPFYMQFTAGAIAGISEILTMYPLDVVKTRFQLQVGNQGYGSISDCFKRIIREEGFGTLYRGILAPILVEAPKRATKFAANEQYSRLYLHLTGLDRITQPLSVLTGVSAGVTEAFVVVPFELVKIRLQDKASAGRYSGTMDCFLKVLRQEGPLAFYKGLEATVWRHAAWNGGYFGVIHGVREVLQKRSTDNRTSSSNQLMNNFIAGSVGGTVGTILNTPFDVAKTRIQNQTINAPSKYGWTISSIRMIAREEGFTALYKGFLPKVLRLGPGGGILLVVFETVTGWMRTRLL